MKAINKRPIKNGSELVNHIYCLKLEIKSLPGFELPLGTDVHTGTASQPSNLTGKQQEKVFAK